MTPACPLGLTALRMPTWTPQVSSYLDPAPRGDLPLPRAVRAGTGLNQLRGCLGRNVAVGAGEAKGMEGEVTTNKAGNGHGCQGAATLRLSCIV
jgi:hypothetical protein